MMQSTDKKRYAIAVDFDGTIVEHRYPAIGAEREGAIETLRKLTSEGHKLILWTVREGKLLDEAVEWCKERGLQFYAVNRNYPEELYDPKETPRKLRDIDFFIDDRNIGGLPPWDVIYQVISDNKPLQQLYDAFPAVDSELTEQMKRYQRGGRSRLHFFRRSKK